MDILEKFVHQIPYFLPVKSMPLNPKITWLERLDNFDGSIRDKHNDVKFVIQDPKLRLVAARELPLWTDSPYYRASWCMDWNCLCIENFTYYHFIIEGDSITVVTWIQKTIRKEFVHPLLGDIVAFLFGYTIFNIWHVYRKANLTANWIVSYIAKHSRNILWIDLERSLTNIVISFFLIFLHVFTQNFYSTNTPSYIYIYI